MSRELNQPKHHSGLIKKIAQGCLLFWVSSAILTGIPVLLFIWLASGLGFSTADRTLYCYHTARERPNCQIKRVDWLDQTAIESVISAEEAVVVSRYSDPVKRNSDQLYYTVQLISSQDLTSSGGYSNNKTLSRAGDLPGTWLKSFSQDERQAADQFISQVNGFIKNKSTQPLTLALQRQKPSHFLVGLLGVAYVLPLLILFCLSCVAGVSALIRPQTPAK